MGSVEEIHDRDREVARELIKRLLKHVDRKEHGDHLGEIQERDNHFIFEFDFEVRGTPMTLSLRVHP